MTPTRTVLSWLLAAAMLLLGLPAAGAAACPAVGQGGGQDGPMSCCVGGTCACQPEASRADCGCRVPDPEPAPLPPLPKQPLQRDADQPDRSTPVLDAAREPDHGVRAAEQRPHGLLPQRSRQEALSVWRL